MRPIRVQRIVAASPERVYRAWLEPDLIRRWWAPQGYDVARAEVDERVGGRIQLWHRDGDTDVGGAVAEIVELVPDRRIVLRWWFVGADRVPDPATRSRLTVTFEPGENGTTSVTLVHDELDGLRAAHPDIADNVEAGWTGTLAVLSEAMTS